jgi:hypothetical protein
MTGSVAWMTDRVERAGFRDVRVTLHDFRWRFASAWALLGHAFMRLAFVPAWMDLVREPDREDLARDLEADLEAACARRGEISLTIPYACLLATR